MIPLDPAQSRLSDSRELLRGASVNLLGILAKSSRTLVTLFVTRVSGPAVFGLFTLANGVVEVGTRLSVFGMDKSLLTFIPEARQGTGAGDGEYRFLSAAFLTSQVLAGFLTLALVVGAPWISMAWFGMPELVWPLRFMALAILPVTLMNLALAATKALKIMAYDALVAGALFPLALLLFAVPILWVEQDAEALSLAYTLAGVVGAGVALWFFRRHYSVLETLARGPGGALKSVVSFSTPLGLHDFILYLAMKLELFVVAFFLEPAAVGIYALAAELAFVMKKFRQIFDPILLPILSEAQGGGQEERVQENLARVVRWILVPGILYLAAMALFARPILGVFGEEFRTGGMVLILLCGAQLANVGTGPLDLAMIASGRPRINLLNISLILVVQTGLNLWLIPRYGLTGAGAAALAAFLFVGLLRFGQGLLILGVNPFHSAQLKPLAAGVVAGLGVALGGWLLPSSDLPFLWVGGLVAVALLYVLVLWLLGLEEEDLKLVKTLMSGGQG